MTENSLIPELQQVLAHKLLALADDELILGHRNSEWTGHAPILEEDIAFANIAQDEMGHARLWYEILQDLNGSIPDQMVFFRDAADFRNARLVELPKGDWALTIMRQYLFDKFELVRATHLLDSEYRPLAATAAKIRLEELYHVQHTHIWLKRLGLGTAESNRRLQQALDSLWPLAFQLFDPLADEQLLVEAGYVPAPALLQAEWKQQVVPELEEAALQVPVTANDQRAPRNEHTPHLERLLEEMQEVARLNPQASW